MVMVCKGVMGEKRKSRLTVNCYLKMLLFDTSKVCKLGGFCATVIRVGSEKFHTQ